MGNLKTATVKTAVLTATLLAAWVPGALAADQWLACEGTKVTTGQNDDGETLNETQPIADIYAYNDDLQGLYFYSQDRQTLSPVAVETYTPAEITWDGEGVWGARWDGVLNRDEMSLNIVRTEKEMRSEWTAQCTPTDAQPIA